MNRAVKGLDVACRIVSATFFPMCCSEEVIKSIANKKGEMRQECKVLTGHYSKFLDWGRRFDGLNRFQIFF
jgi:hypothetical protein